MSLEEEITRAVRHHKRWKLEFRFAINSGEQITDAADIGKDNICAFGHWLYGSTIPKDARFDPHYIIVKYIHEKFHECAGRLVRLLSEGKKAEAIALLSDDGEYTRNSDQLVEAMERWKDSVHKIRERAYLNYSMISWKHISGAPLNRDIQLAIIDRQGTHELVFACRRIVDGWINSETKQRIDITPTHWREWAQVRRAANG